METEFSKLYEFIDLAEKNRKYPANTAHGRRAALKLFETALNLDELESLDLIQQRIEEIYLTLIARHKNTYSIQSLNTYKGRFLKVIEDYKRYGINPDSIIQWEVKPRKYASKDKDTEEDSIQEDVSLPVHRGVHKLQIALEDGSYCTLELPKTIDSKDADTIYKILKSIAS
jgi:hypothetical protein